VNNDNLTKSVFVVLLLVSSVAAAEDKYPASDFQPKVVYQDESVGKDAASNTAEKSAPVTSSSSDSQYPAANFEPKVVFSDTDYKHTAASPNPNANSSMSSSGQSDTNASSSDTSATAVAKDESSVGYMLGLVVLAVAGFVLFKKGTGETAKAKAGNAAKNPSGLTGVARYVLRASGTGVSRYLEKNAKNVVPVSSRGAATGVAKYLASQDSKPAQTANKAATRVEKYLRNKG